MVRHSMVGVMRVWAVAAAILASVGFAGAAFADEAPSGADVRAVVPADAGVGGGTLRRGGGVLCCDVPAGCPCPTSCWPDPLLRVPCLDDCHDQFQKSKETSCLKLGAGAYHWFHYDNNLNRWDYGYPTAKGTYFYYVNADIECETCSCVKVGAHAQVRFRDASPFRAFFRDDRVWLYEGYATVKAPAWGTVKAGKVWSRFGLDWDDSFWGNVAYYNGYKLDPDWGVSWEHSVEWTRLALPWFVQVFFGEDDVNGSIPGGDAESSAIVSEDITGIVRVVPTYHVNENMDVALGLSALAGSVTATNGSESSRYAVAADLTFTWCGLKVYGEYIHGDGGVHEAHYVTLGQSDTKDILQVGGGYTYGPATVRAAYSRGDYKRPGGDESILLFGLDVKVTKWLTFTAEYQDWKVNRPGVPATISFEDGLSFILHWDI